MKNFKSLIAICFVLALASLSYGQTSLVQTTLSAAVTSTSTQTVTVASATGIATPSNSAQTVLFVDQEAMYVTAVSGTSINVFRGYQGTPVQTHVSGARVLVGPISNGVSAFNSLTIGVNAAGDLGGSCTAANTLYTPQLNIKNGNQWLCSTVTLTWVPGWGNTSRPAAPTAAVASAAGVILPSGPLFHVTGALAITGFTIPVGFPVKSGGGFCVIPDGTFTTTTASNIALASTAVVNKTLCFTYDTANAKFTPSY
jgi:hypothetical protein